MSRGLVERGVVAVVAVAFGLWGIPLLPAWVGLLLVGAGAILMLVEFSRWLDRNAY